MVLFVQGRVATHVGCGHQVIDRPMSCNRFMNGSSTSNDRLEFRSISHMCLCRCRYTLLCRRGWYGSVFTSEDVPFGVAERIDQCGLVRVDTGRPIPSDETWTMCYYPMPDEVDKTSYFKLVETVYNGISLYVSIRSSHRPNRLSTTSIASCSSVVSISSVASLSTRSPLIT